MKFRLYFNPNYLFAVLRENQSPPEDALLLAERDPEVPIEVKLGWAYYNPLLLNKEGLQVFLGTAENLIGYRTGRPPAKRSKADTLQQARGWFELTPATLRYPKDLDPELEQLIEFSPKLSGVITQKIRTKLGLAAPDSLQDKASWIEWLTNQSIPLRPEIKNGLAALYNNPSNLLFSESNRQYLLAGTPPQTQWHVLIRWVEIRQSKWVAQQLFESPQWTFTVPENVVQTGAQALLEHANKTLPRWAELEAYPTGENKLSESAPETISVGPVIFIRPEYSETWGLCHTPANWNDRIESVTDLLNQAIKNNERPA